MGKGVFIHNPGTQYDDDPATRYHFPKMYLERVKPIVGDYVLYYQSGAKGGYTGTAIVERIYPDPKDPTGHFYAAIKPHSYTHFPDFVPFRVSGKIMNSFLDNGDGTVNRGKQVWAVRQISDIDFVKIITLAAKDDSELPRYDVALEVKENEQSPFEVDIERPVVEVVLNKKVRDRMFRTKVVSAYNKTCAITGMSLINGGGRAEVEAAHIKPVSENGPDIISNALALSGTIHWMFDRGLLALSNDYAIEVSRKVNNVDEVNRLINNSRKAILPKDEANWPHPRYLEWHRDYHDFQANRH